MRAGRATLRFLEQAAREAGHDVRWGSGPFQGGLCTVRGRPVIVLNRQHPSEASIEALLSALEALSLDELPLAKSTRNRLERMIGQRAAR